MSTAILYSRTSKADGSQHTENQAQALQAWARQHTEYDVIEIADEQSSTKTRPGKERALKMLRSRKARCVVVWKLDRWARNSSEFMLELDETIAGDWNIISLTEGIDLTTPMGKAMVRIGAVFAELERDVIRERTQLGVTHAQAIGKHTGRPTKEMLRRGWEPGRLCSEYGCAKHVATEAA